MWRSKLNLAVMSNRTLYENDKAHTESAVDGKNPFWKYEMQPRKCMNVKVHCLLRIIFIECDN